MTINCSNATREISKIDSTLNRLLSKKATLLKKEKDDILKSVKKEHKNSSSLVDF